MAKKQTVRLTSTTAKHDANLAHLPIKGGDGLPEYQRYFTCKDFCFFFEPPRCKSEVNKSLRNISSSKSAFNIFSDGKDLVGVEIAKTFCRLLIQSFKIKPVKKPDDFNLSIKRLFHYLASLEEKPFAFKDITLNIYVDFLLSLPNELQAKAGKTCFQRILPLHPHSKLLNINSISVHRQHKSRIQDLDLDSLLDEKDYSDRVMMQMLAYCFYDLEIWKKRWELMQSTTKESLGEDYFDKYSINDHNLVKALSSGKEGHDKLFLNFLLECKAERAGKILHRDNIQTNRIRSIVKGKGYKGINGRADYVAYHKYLANKMWSYYAKADQPEPRPYLKFETQHMPAVLALFLMISTGKNKETILSIKRNYGNKAWYENFDINLGVDDKTPASQKIIRVIGHKTRGAFGIKKIPMRIPINSPIFEYMKLYDDIVNAPTREYFFNFKSSSTLLQTHKVFCNSYKILDDNNEVLTSIETPRLRKTFAGHLLLQMVEDVDNAEDLVSKLREALNHKEFDTTLFSYIMKTGVGNQVINAAIVALTSNMLEKAMVFQGTICEETERDARNKQVYLCDCTDDTSPTHNLPIADRCKKYDMCLGCERSEVYAMHIPKICYRVMQYDEVAKKNPLGFSGLLEDRRQIALDTIGRFSNEHGRGVEIVEHGYAEAARAMKNNRPLLPTIIQFQ
ncbi:hypothetical protein Q4567_02980 [Aliiglaciecola sp. 2_MG-2023]|uniref:hypothetical protein n=1 Tax=unclassified Aliiglaciecola TaxID=2593648 RepID=UPI0026E256A4|nr:MULTISPECIES: hypothetical protein [unclassified Aliiglaciecola]MDO6709680.1 hypothetical protein [Aliiglaciecola sp. 2_MG-2023]MDO6750778.1 hypothetical protein [Aliiglaciecola sp. 1_MG-2023]